MKRKSAGFNDAGFYLIAGVIVVLGLTCWSPAPRDGTTVVPQPAPHHWEYREYPAGGLMLSDPLAIPDSLGHIPTILIPPGSILVVPKWVEGEEPEQRRDQS